MQRDERPAIERWRENLLAERDGVALYSGLANVDTNAERARTLRELAADERRHAAIWERKLSEAGAALPEDVPTSRVRMLIWFARRLGVRAVLPFVVRAETADADMYTGQPDEAVALAAEEREHAATLVRLGGGESSPTEQSRIFERESWHRSGRAGSLRAAVFGMNDGLVSNVALVLGVAAAGTAPGTVILTGLAGLLAGAFSMAVGEYVSVASQRDMLRRQVELEAREIQDAPEEEAKELTELLVQKGVSRDYATKMATELMKNPAAALDTMVREELGLDPTDLGSPLAAALSSFVTFALGAVLPLAPFLLTTGATAAGISGAVCAVTLALVGGFLGVLSGTNPLRSAGRMVGLAALAVAVTVTVGRLVGVNLG